MKFISILSLLFLGLSTCNEQSKKEPTQGEQIIFNAIDTHGGDRYETAHFQFVFRDKTYSFQNNKALYEYTVSYEKDGLARYTEMNNETITHFVDGKNKMLNEKEKAGHRESLNSVIYFASLPHKLLDKSVNKTYVGDTEIKNEKYDIIRVTFNQKGGGKDFDDVYHYWVHKKTNEINYLAYNYTVNNGGVRFRSAYNKRVVGGILFQDYVNYKADVGTPLVDLPKLWEEGKLKELSRIETEDVKQLSK